MAACAEKHKITEFIVSCVGFFVFVLMVFIIHSANNRFVSFLFAFYEIAKRKPAVWSINTNKKLKIASKLEQTMTNSKSVISLWYTLNAKIWAGVLVLYEWNVKLTNNFIIQSIKTSNYYSLAAAK